MDNASSRPTFSAADFENGRAFEWLENQPDGYSKTCNEEWLSESARKLKVTGYRKKLAAFRRELRQIYKMENPSASVRTESFDGLNVDLNIGEWQIDKSSGSIWKPSDTQGKRPIIACSHPVLPVQILRSLDTNLVKVKLAYRKPGVKKWTYSTVPMSTISSARDIVGLSDLSISVTSGQRAQAMVDFFRDVIDLNPDVIAEVDSTSRLGWVGNDFVPYSRNISFDGTATFKPVYDAIVTHGNYDAWKEEAVEIRKYSRTAQIVLAASFAAPLIEKLGCLPFFVHLWSMESGTGKTVAQMLGASVWGNPAVGGSFFQTFKSTSVGLEVMAGFLHSIPVFLDELQLAKDNRGKVIFNVYELASGSGKTRSNKNLGISNTNTWATCFITSGETPIVSDTDGAGALNRVFEIECKAGDMVIKDGHKTSGVLKNNYGFAGAEFVELLSQPGNLEIAKTLYEANYHDCLKYDTTEKQAASAALILAADQLATEWIFKDGAELTVEKMSEFLKGHLEISLADRTYEAICSWVAANAAHFKEDSSPLECYGVIDGRYAVINSTSWNRVCGELCVDNRALLSSLKAKDLLRTTVKGCKMNKRINGVSVPCVWMKLPDGGGQPGTAVDSGGDEIPF